MNELIDKFNAVPLTHKIFVLFVVMVGIFVGYFMGIYTPMTEEIADLKQEASELQREEGRLIEIRENQAEMEAKIQELNQQLQVAREQLPESAEIPNLLQRVYNQAKTAGLTIEVFQRNDEVPQQDFIEIPVEMELAGTFDEVANFFFFVGRMTRIINIDELSLDRQASGLEADGDLSVTARATTYRWSPGGGAEE